MCKTIQGVEFEYVLSKHIDDTCGAFDEIRDAHNAEIQGLKSRIAELEADKAELLEALKAKNDLLLCYRLGKRPSNFDRLAKANATIKKYCNKEEK